MMVSHRCCVAEGIALQRLGCHANNTFHLQPPLEKFTKLLVQHLARAVQHRCLVFLGNADAECCANHLEGLCRHQGGGKIFFIVAGGLHKLLPTMLYFSELRNVLRDRLRADGDTGNRLCHHPTYRHCQPAAAQ